MIQTMILCLLISYWLIEKDEEERKRVASHTVEIQLADNTTVSCSAVGEFAELQPGYALSVHKARGSEWPNVFSAPRHQ